MSKIVVDESVVMIPKHIRLPEQLVAIVQKKANAAHRSFNGQLVADLESIYGGAAVVPAKPSRAKAAGAKKKRRVK